MGKTYDAAIPGSRLPYTEEARSKKKREARRSEKREEARSEKKREARRREKRVRMSGILSLFTYVEGRNWSCYESTCISLVINH